MIYTIKHPAELGIFVQQTAGNWKSIADIKTRVGADVCINAQMWEFSTGRTCYALRINGETLATDGAWVWGYGWGKGETALHWDSADHAAKYDNYVGCEKLVVGGKVEYHESAGNAYGGRRGRTALGVAEDGSIVCLVTSDAAPMTLDELGRAMIGAGCVTAIMLDGGGSSQMDCPDGRVVSSRLVQSVFWARCAGNPYQEPVSNVRSGSAGDVCKWVQWELRERGYDVDVDGYFSTADVAALTVFQRSAGLDADGICGPLTRAALKKHEAETERPVLGIDCATPLTDTTAAAIRAAGYQFAARYMVPESFGFKVLKPDEIKAIHGAGLAIMPIYETTGMRTMGGAAHGAADGKTALAQAKALGLPLGSVIWFAECDYYVEDALLDQVEAYLTAAQTALGDAYHAGLYGQYSVVEAMHSRGVERLWQCVAWSKGQVSDHADVYQSQAERRVGGVEVDIDEAVSLDGMWLPEPQGATEEPQTGWEASAPTEPEKTLEERVAALEAVVFGGDDFKKPGCSGDACVIDPALA